MLASRDPATLVTFSRGEAIGQYSDALAGLASLLAAITVLVLIFRRMRTTEWEALDVSVIALFVAEAIQGIGHIMEFKWVVEGKAYTGAFCSAQGFLRQFAPTSAAFFTLTIAVQTFLTIWRAKLLDRAFAVVVIVVESVIVLLMTAIGHAVYTHQAKNEYYVVPTPYWCWIGKQFFHQRIGLEYFWFWLTAFGSLILYIPLFFLHFGYIKQRLPSSDVQAREHDPEAGRSSMIPKDSFQVLSGGKKLWSTIFYPILYFIIVLPLSVVRFIGFHEEATLGYSHPRPAAELSVVVFLSLSGVFNAILYRITRSDFFNVTTPQEPKAPELKVQPPSVSVS